jgi:hypothetical protein
MNTISLFNKLGFKHWAEVIDKVSLFILGALVVKGIKYSDHYSTVNTLLLAVVALVSLAAGLAIYMKVPRGAVITLLIAVSVAIIIAIGGYNLWIM